MISSFSNCAYLPYTPFIFIFFNLPIFINSMPFA